MKELNIKETIEAIKKIEKSRLASAGNVDLMGVRPLSSKSSAMLGQLCKPLIDRGIMEIDYDGQMTAHDVVYGRKTNKKPSTRKTESLLESVIFVKEFGEELGDCTCCCDLKIFKKGNKHYVVLTNLPESKGTSVTKAFEVLATDIFDQYLSNIQVENICWIQGNLHDANEYEIETFDLVHLTFDPESREFASPKWEPFNDKEVIKLIKECL